jgi:hypothetical protein
MTLEDWQQERWGCVHGYLEPYCSQCAGDRRRRTQEERQQAREEGQEVEHLQNRLVAADEAIQNQSRALNQAYRYIQALENELRKRRRQMEPTEMVQILEDIIRDPETNATARCTAIRTLRELQADMPKTARDEFDELDALANVASLDKKRRYRAPAS